MWSCVWYSLLPAIVLDWFLNQTIIANEEVLIMPCQAISEPEAKGKMYTLGFKGSKLITNNIQNLFHSSCFRMRNLLCFTIRPDQVAILNKF